MRRSALLSTLVVTAGLVLASPVNPAQAAVACTAAVSLPAKIAIKSDDTVFVARLTGCAGKFDYVAASLSGPSGTLDYLSFDGVRSVNSHVYSWDVRPGVHGTTGGIGYTVDFDEIALKRTTTTIKFGTWAGAAASRTNGVTTVTAAAKRYSSMQGFVAYPGTVVGVQSAPSAKGPWTTVGFVRATSAGRATLTTRSSAPYFRTWFGDTGSFFGSTSAPAKVVQRAAPQPTLTRTWAGVSATRISGVTSVTAAAKRSSASGFVAAAGIVVGVQSASSSRGPWTTVGYVRTNSAGRAVLSTRSAAGWYRTWFGATASSAAATSAPTAVVVRTAPAPTPTPTPPPVVQPPSDVYYANCTDVWNRLGRPIYPSDPGFRSAFDRDGDGVGCESRP